MSADLLFVSAFAAKIVLTAGIVAGAAMATERAGPLLGALILTLPIGAGPAYFFLALDHPPEFIAASALGSLAVNAANGVFGLVYAALAQRRGLAASLLSALAAWVALAAILRSIEWTLASVLLLNAGVYAVCLPLVARFRHAAMPIYRRRWYDAPLRALLVCANRLGGGGPERPGRPDRDRHSRHRAGGDDQHGADPAPAGRRRGLGRGDRQRPDRLGGLRHVPGRPARCGSAPRQGRRARALAARQHGMESVPVGAVAAADAGAQVIARRDRFRVIGTFPRLWRLGVRPVEAKGAA